MQLNTSRQSALHSHAAACDFQSRVASKPCMALTAVMGIESPLSRNAGRRRRMRCSRLAARVLRRKPSPVRLLSAVTACSESLSSCKCVACLPACLHLNIVVRAVCIAGWTAAGKPHSGRCAGSRRCAGLAPEAFLWGLPQEERAGYPHDAPAHRAAAQLHAPVQ